MGMMLNLYTYVYHYNWIEWLDTEMGLVLGNSSFSKEYFFHKGTVKNTGEKSNQGGMLQKQ